MSIALCRLPPLTFVVMPHSDFGELAQTEHIRKPKHVLHFPLKLVPVGALLQRQHPGVAVLPKHNQKHVGVGAAT